MLMETHNDVSNWMSGELGNFSLKNKWKLVRFGAPVKMAAINKGTACRLMHLVELCLLKVAEFYAAAAHIILNMMKLAKY